MEGLLSQGGEQEKYCASCVTIFAVLVQFDENFSVFLGNEVVEPEQTGVYIRYDGFDDRFVDVTKFDIFVDGIDIVEAGDFIEAFACFFASFFVFNLEFPKSVEKSMLFFEKMMLKSPSACEKKTKVGKKIINVISSLNSSGDVNAKRRKMSKRGK